MKQRTSILVGMLVAALIPSLALAAGALISDWHRVSTSISELLIFAGVSFAIFLCFSLPAVVVIGLPLFLVAKRLHAMTWWSAFLGGAVAGLLVTLVVKHNNETYLGAATVYVPLAVISAIAFFLIWKMGNRD